MLGSRRALLGSTGIKPLFSANFVGLSALPAGLASSRAGNAMMFDSTGTLTYAPNNLLTYSNTFTNAAWTTFALNLTTGVSDPIGGTAATRIAATNNNAYVFATASSNTSINFVSSIWVRRVAGTGAVKLQTPNGTNTTISVTSSWVQYYTSGPGASPSSVVALVVSTIGDVVDIYAGVLSAVTYETTPRPGDQVITTTAAYYGPRFDYNPATLAAKGWLNEAAATNLGVLSSAPGSSATYFDLYKATVGTDGTLAPDAASSAYYIADSDTTTDAHRINYKSTAISFTSGTTYTASAYAKASSLGYLQLSLGTASFPSNASAYFNLSSGVVVSVGAGAVSAKVDTLSGGWYRLSLVATANATTTASVFYNPSADGTTVSFVGVSGRKSVYVWGTQVNSGAHAGSYIPNLTASTVTRAADVPASASPLTALLAAYPSVVELQDEATGVISRAQYAAGAFTFPTGKWYRSMAVAPTIPSNWLTVGAPYR